MMFNVFLLFSMSGSDGCPDLHQCDQMISPSHAVKLAAAANLIESLRKSFVIGLHVGFVIFGDIKGKTWS